MAGNQRRRPAAWTSTRAEILRRRLGEESSWEGTTRRVGARRVVGLLPRPRNVARRGRRRLARLRRTPLAALRIDAGRGSARATGRLGFAAKRFERGCGGAFIGRDRALGVRAKGGKGGARMEGRRRAGRRARTGVELWLGGRRVMTGGATRR